MEVCGSQEAQHGFGWVVGEHNIFFHADDGQIEGRNQIWIQKSLTAMVRMFERVDLQTNLSKTKTMVCRPGFGWGQQVIDAYKGRATERNPPFGKGREPG